MLRGPYAVFTSATLAHHSYACHAKTGVPDDRGWLMSARPVILSTRLFWAFSTVDTLRWLSTCDTKVHCAYYQMFIQMPLSKLLSLIFQSFPLHIADQFARLFATAHVFIYILTLDNYPFTQSDDQMQCLKLCPLGICFLATAFQGH